MTDTLREEDLRVLKQDQDIRDTFNRTPRGLFTASESLHSQFDSRLAELRIKNEVVKEFRKGYLKVRTDNILLDHQTAIELVKMIHADADTLTFEDTQ